MSSEAHGLLRLLVIGGPHSANPNEDGEPFGEALCEWAEDLYAALARLVSEPQIFDALVLMPECLTRAAIAAVPLVRKHLKIPVWIWDKNAAAFRADVEQALAHGAVRFSSGHRMAQNSAPVRNLEHNAPAILPPQVNGNGNGPAHPHPLTGKIPIRSDQELAADGKSVAIDGRPRYDDSTQEPLLTDAELKALLDDVP